MFQKIVVLILFSVVLLSTVHAVEIPSPDKATLQGMVTDKTTGSPLIGVNIYFPDLKIGAITDVHGKYVIMNLPLTTSNVEVSYMGYQTITKSVNLRVTHLLNFEMAESPSELNEVVVTGVSKATRINQNPVPIVAVSKAYLNENSASNNVIAEISHLPGISAVTTGPNISKPFIHGLGYNRVVTLLDGIRIEGQQWGDEHGIEVDQNAINRIEVIKGPASLTYGSGAEAGVVNLITAPTVPDGKILGSFSNDYGTNNGLFNTSFEMQGNQHGLVWGTVLTNKIAKNYSNPHDGRVYATGFKEKDARAMIGINKSWGYSYLNASLFDDIQDIPDGSRDSLRRFTYQITDADTYRPVVPQSILNSYATPVLHQHVQMYNLYDNSNFNIGNSSMIVNIGYQYSHRREYTHPENPTVPGLNLELHTLNYDVKYDLPLENGYDVTVGINGMYQDNKLGNNSTDFPIPGYHQLDFGAFVFGKKSFGKFDLSGGVRYDVRTLHSQSAYIDTLIEYFPSLYYGSNPASAPNVVQQFEGFHKRFSGASGSIGTTYNVSSSFFIKANLATGFRAPSIAELSANGPDPGSQIYHVGDLQFQPEFSVQGDVGVYLNLPSITASADIYDNNIDHYIFQEQMVDANGTPERVNANGSLNPDGQYARFTYTQTKARIFGGDFSLDFHIFPWLHFENALTLTYGTNLGTNGNEPDSLRYLPFIPPLHTYSTLRATFAKGFHWFRNLYGFVGFTHYEPQHRFFSAYGTETYTAGYNLLSAGFGGNIVNKNGKKIIELYVEGTNLANVSYQSNMSRLKYFDNPVVPEGIQPGIFNMGRNVSIKMVVPFDLSPHGKGI